MVEAHWDVEVAGPRDFQGLCIDKSQRFLDTGDRRVCG